MLNAAGCWMKYEGSARGLLTLPSLSGVCVGLGPKSVGVGNIPFTHFYGKLLHGKECKSTEVDHVHQ